ncbi:hypothetical protein [Longispora urticae]
MTTNQAVVLSATELLLAPPYGDEKGAISDTRTLYSGAVELFGQVTGTPVPVPDFDSQPVLACVRRGVLDQALAEINRNPEADLDLGAARSISTTTTRQRVGPDGPLVMSDWESDPAARWIADKVRFAFQRDAGIENGIGFVEPTDTVVARITDSLALLRAVVPEITASAMAHVGAVAVLRAPFESAHLFETPHVIYVDRRMLRHPLVGADSILHESLHQKLVDLRVARFYTKAEFSTAGEGDVVIPWGQSAPGTVRTWPVGRVVSACHVYVHLTLLHLAALSPEHERLGLDADQVIDRLVTRYARGRHLSDQLAVSEFRDQLGSDGVGLARDFEAALDILGSARIGDRRLDTYGTHYDGVNTR